MSARGIAFLSAVDTCAMWIFPACHIKLLADLYQMSAYSNQHVGLHENLKINAIRENL